MKIYFSLAKETGCLEQALSAAFAGHDLKFNAGRTDWEEGSKMQEANDWPADLYVALRTGKSGLKLLAAGKENGKSWTACASVAEKLRHLNGRAVEIENGDQYAEISQTRMTSVYIILPNDPAWAQENAVSIAAGVSAGLVGMSAKTDEKPGAGENQGVSGETGAFDEVSDAELGRALRVLLKELGKGK